MSIGIGIEDLGTLQSVDKRIKRLSSLDLTALLEGIGAEVETQTRRRIAEEKRAPDGSDWPDWKASYAGQKHGRSESHGKHKGNLRQSGSHSLLQLDGDLLDTIQFVVDADDVKIGSNKVYAATQQHGDPERGIEAREFLGLSEENSDDIEDMVVQFLNEVIQ